MIPAPCGQRSWRWVPSSSVRTGRRPTRSGSPAIAAEIARGVGSGRPAEALLAAIGRCGELLREKRLAARPDDQNELPDGLRVLPG